MAKKAAQAKVKKTPRRPGGRKLNIKYLGGQLLKKMIRAGATELGNNAGEVNSLNVFPVPDGDTGDNMRMTIESGVRAIETMNSDNLAEVMKALSHGMLLGARGNSGVILSQFFAGTARGLEESRRADPSALGQALEVGVQQAYASVMTPAEGTILTVAREAVEYAVGRINEKSTIRSLFADLVKEMHDSVQRTPEILTVLKDAKVVDSGGAGLFYIMDGFNRVLNGEDIAEETPVTETPLRQNDLFDFDKDSEMTYGYCTEFLLQLQSSKTDTDNFDTDAFKKFLSENGNSVVAFKTGSRVKVHIHTFCPEKILAYARQFGEFLSVKIENMSVQHTDLSKSDTDTTQTDMRKEQKAERKNKSQYGVVAVCNGEGIERIFREFGADEIIRGGQMNNPSTNDFLDKFAKVRAEHIFVFPNNSNICMAASQAADLYDLAQVHVIPSKNIGMGYSALTSANFECPDPDTVIKEMTEAMMSVSVGYVSPAARDADMNGVHVSRGDTIGIIDKQIVVSSPKKSEALFALVSELLGVEGKTMLTVFCGIDAEEDERAALTEYIESSHPDTEVYFIDGGQDIYPYIFLAE